MLQFSDTDNQVAKNNNTKYENSNVPKRWNGQRYTVTADDENIDSDSEYEIWDENIAIDTNDGEEDENGKVNVNVKPDYDQIETIMSIAKFEAKMNLPTMDNAAMFQQLGFKNPNDCKILCKSTKELVCKYPVV